MTDQIMSGTSNLPTQPKQKLSTDTGTIHFHFNWTSKISHTKWTLGTQAEKYPQFIANKFQAEYT